MPPLHIGDPSGLRLVAVVCAEVSALTSDRVISKARRASCVMHRVWSGPNFQGQHADEVSMFKVLPPTDRFTRILVMWGISQVRSCPTALTFTSIV